MRLASCGAAVVLVALAGLGLAMPSGRSAQFVSTDAATLLRGGGAGGGILCVKAPYSTTNGNGCWNATGTATGASGDKYTVRCNRDATMDRVCLCAEVSEGVGCITGKEACSGREDIWNADMETWVFLYEECADVSYNIVTTQDGCTDTCVTTP